RRIKASENKSSDNEWNTDGSSMASQPSGDVRRHGTTDSDSVKRKDKKYFSQHPAPGLLPSFSCTERRLDRCVDSRGCTHNEWYTRHHADSMDRFASDLSGHISQPPEHPLQMQGEAGHYHH